MATFEPGQTALFDKLLRRSSAAAPVPIGKQKHALQPDLQAVIQTLKIGARIVRYELTDGEWAAIKPMLPNKPRGVPRVNDRRVLNGILWV